MGAMKAVSSDKSEECRNEILELIEGEDLETLQEQLRLLKCHMAVKAGVIKGTMSIKTAMQIEGIE